MGIMGKLASGFAGNLSEVSPESLMQEFGMYLMDGETITTGFKLIRDVVIVTNRRIIDFDKQGATGAKMRVDSINLNCIFHVSAETAGFGVDDSEINIYYITSPYFKPTAVYPPQKRNWNFPKSIISSPFINIFRRSPITTTKL